MGGCRPSEILRVLRWNPWVTTFIYGLCATTYCWRIFHKWWVFSSSENEMNDDGNDEENNRRKLRCWVLAFQTETYTSGIEFHWKASVEDWFWIVWMEQFRVRLFIWAQHSPMWCWYECLDCICDVMRWTCFCMPFAIHVKTSNDQKEFVWLFEWHGGHFCQWRIWNNALFSSLSLFACIRALESESRLLSLLWPGAHSNRTSFSSDSQSTINTNGTFHIECTAQHSTVRYFCPRRWICLCPMSVSSIFEK